MPCGLSRRSRIQTRTTPRRAGFALTQSWLGNSAAALEAADKYVTLETDEGTLPTLGLWHVLCLGQGMEDHADVVEYSVAMALPNPQAFVDALGKLDKEGLLAGVRVEKEEGVLTGVIVEKPSPALTAELETKQNPTLGAYLALMGNIVRLWNTSKDSLDRTQRLLKERAGAALGESYPARGPAKFFDVLSECLIFPRLASEADFEPRMRAHLEKFFEETWIHRPLKSLAQVAPIDTLVPRRRIEKVERTGAVRSEILPSLPSFRMTSIGCAASSAWLRAPRLPQVKPQHLISPPWRPPS